MNCISWMVGHLAWQEQRYWLQAGQRQIPFPDLNEMHAYGKPACTPPMGEIWATWQAVTAAADPWLDALTQETLAAPIKPNAATVGSLLLRTTYHYWYHLGEAMALRQLLEKGPTPDFVGDIDTEAPYRPEPAMRDAAPALTNAGA